MNATITDTTIRQLNILSVEQRQQQFDDLVEEFQKAYCAEGAVIRGQLELDDHGATFRFPDQTHLRLSRNGKLYVEAEKRDGQNGRNGRNGRP